MTAPLADIVVFDEMVDVGPASADPVVTTGSPFTDTQI
jgi:hypothetical protein